MISNMSLRSKQTSTKHMAIKLIPIRPKTVLLRLFNYSNVPFRTSTMKKYICILAGAALLAACEQKETTVTNPPAEKKTENNTTIVKESPAPTEKTETKTETNINVRTSPSP